MPTLTCYYLNTNNINLEITDWQKFYSYIESMRLPLNAHASEMVDLLVREIPCSVAETHLCPNFKGSSSHIPITKNHQLWTGQ
jgi:hypothetical protein